MKKIVFTTLFLLMAMITILKSNDLKPLTIYVYKMQPVVSEGDDVTPKVAVQKVIKKPAPITLEIPHKDIAQRRQKEFYQAPIVKPVPYEYKQATASAAPMNIIPNFIPMATEIFQLSFIVNQNNQVMQAPIRDNGPVLFRQVPRESQMASKNYITLPIEEAKPSVLAYH